MSRRQTAALTQINSLPPADFRITSSGQVGIVRLEDEIEAQGDSGGTGDGEVVFLSHVVLPDQIM